MKTKSLIELIEEFEQMALNSHYYIEQSGRGTYHKDRTNTLWAGYWECAVKNGIIVGDDADWIKMLGKKKEMFTTVEEITD